MLSAPGKEEEELRKQLSKIRFFSRLVSPLTNDAQGQLILPENN